MNKKKSKSKDSLGNVTTNLTNNKLANVSNHHQPPTNHYYNHHRHNHNHHTKNK